MKKFLKWVLIILAIWTGLKIAGCLFGFLWVFAKFFLVIAFIILFVYYGGKILRSSKS